MSRFLSRADWPLIGAGVLAGMLTTAVVLYLFFTGIGGQPPADASRINDRVPGAEPAPRSDGGRGPIRERESSIVERLASRPPPTRPLRDPLALTVRNLVWTERNGARFAQVELATARISTTALERGDVVIENAVLQQPVIALREDAQGNWNYEQVFAELLEDDGTNDNGEHRPGQHEPLIQVRGLHIDRGRVTVDRPADHLVLENVDGDLPVVSMVQPGIAEPYLRIDRVSTVITRPGTEMRMPLTVADGLVHFPTGRIVFELASVRVEETRLADVNGVWNPADPGYGVTARGRAVAVRFEDIRFLAPDRLPERGVASFEWRVRPVAPEATEVALSGLDVRSGESQVSGALVVRVEPNGFVLRDADLRIDPVEVSLIERFTGPLPYGGVLVGDVTGTGGNIHFDLTANLTTATLPRPFTAALNGRVRMDIDGPIIQQLDVALDRVPLVALREVAPGLPLSGVVTGNVSLRGPPNRAPLDVDMRLELGAGVAVVEGTVDLTGTTPRYDLTGNVVGIDMQSILEPAVPPVQLTARFALNGAGTDPSTLTANVSVAGRFRGWQTTAADTVDVSATIRDGTIQVHPLNLRVANATVAANGDWRFAEPASGAVTYRLTVASLAPWGPYLPVAGDSLAAGSIDASGSLTGSLERMHLAGEASGRDVRAGGWSATSLDTEYDVLLGDAVPTAQVDLTANNVGTPTAGAYSQARLAVRLQPPDLRIELTADRATGGGGVDVLATGEIPLEGERSALLERAFIDLEAGRWQLAQPATFRWGGADGLTVGNLEFRNATSDGRVFVDGRVLPLERSDFRLSLAALPVGDVQRLVRRDPPPLVGTLWADGSVRGGTAPEIDMEFRVDNGALQDVPIVRLEGDVAYSAGALHVQGQAAFDTAGSIELDVRLPARLSLTDSVDFAVRDEGALDGFVTARRVSIAPFAASLPRVRNLTGFLDGTIRLAGTAAEPRGEGALTLQQGYATVPELNQSYSEISGRFGLREGRIVVEDLRARSDGWLIINGGAELENLTSPVFDLRVELNRFRAMGVADQDDAAAYGSLTVKGPLDAIVLTGGVRVEEGTIVLPQIGGGLDRQLIDITRPAPALGQRIEAAGGTDWMRNLRVDDLRVEVGDNTWFMAQEARIQLSGRLTVNKTGDATPITGTLEGNRGQYALVAGPIIRRFEIVSAQVRFLGSPEPNPAIDFTARRAIVDANGRQVDVDVRITGTLERPSVQLASQDLSTLPESELASFLLFGQPSFALGGNVLPGDQLLEQTFFGGFAELAALELERSLGGLGLDVVQIRLGAGPFGGVGSPTVVLGRQLAPDFFLTVETGINALFADSETPLNTWSARLDWTFDRQSRLRLALEPVRLGRSLRGAGLVLPVRPPRQQLLLELRRRWNW